MSCFACASEIKSCAVTCSECGLASYCDAECQEKGLKVFNHGHHCSLISVRKPPMTAVSNLGVIIYVEDAHNTQESDNLPTYRWFEDFMVAHVRELRWRPALPPQDEILIDAKKDFNFFNTVYTTLMTFMREEMKVEKIENPRPEDEWYFSRVAYAAADMATEPGRFPAGFAYTYLLEQMWYTLDIGLNLEKAYTAKLKRDTEAKKRKAEEPLLDLARHEKEEREHKRQRIDAELREALAEREHVPIPMDMYLHIIVKQLPARDAIRLVLRTTKELQHAAADLVPGVRRELEEALRRGEITPQSKAFSIDRERRAAAFIEDMLIRRDFLDPMEEIQQRTMKEEEVKKVARLKEVAALLLNLNYETITFVIWYVSNEYEELTATMTLQDLENLLRSPGMPLSLRRVPVISSYYNAVVSNLPDVGPSRKSSIFFSGANGLRFSFNPDIDWEVTKRHQFRLDQAPSFDSGDFSWMQELIELNQKIRSAPSALVANLIRRFIGFIWRAIDPTLTVYYILAQHPYILNASLNVQVPVASSLLHGQESFQTANLAVRSLRYGRRYRVYFDPAFPIVRSAGVVKRLTREPFTTTF